MAEHGSCESYDLSEILARYQGKESEVIPILQEVQEKFGYLPEETMAQVAEFCRVPESAVFGVASFYAQFRFVPIGKKRVMVCRGTACHVRGARKILDEVEKRLGIEEGETTPDLEYTLETVACIGCCARAPSVMIEEKGETVVQTNLSPRKIAELFAKGDAEGDI